MTRNTRRNTKRMLREAERMGHDTFEGDPLAEYRDRPVAFMRALVDPDTGEPFDPYPEQVRFLEEGFTLTEEGTLHSPELVFSAPKKSGKTTLAAVVLIYVVRVLGGKYAEGYVLANDFDQAAGRVFAQAVKIIEMSPLLRDTARSGVKVSG